MTAGMAGTTGVAEIQGLYGPFSFSEILLQEIWSRRDFDLRHARTTDGRPVRILDAGRWNRLGGPDFLDARLQIGGETRFGDVELHLYASDWEAHGHERDPAYGRVVLHVVLFPTQAQGTSGPRESIPILVLLPLLNHDLEEYAADSAIERMADRHFSEAAQLLLAMPQEARDCLLLQHARRRWAEKVHFAKVRVERLGWTEACHQTALEVLGYRFNRAAMLSVAAEHPLVEWGKGDEALPAVAFSEHAGRWRRQGVRPANDPRIRLQQYARWAKARPGWPDDLAKRLKALPCPAAGKLMETAKQRREVKLPNLWHRFHEELVAGEVGGSRLNTLICDCFLPLLAAMAGETDLSGLWHIWPAGDVPSKFGRLLREVGACGGRGRPMCHGAIQGLLGWSVARGTRSEAIRRSSAGRGA